MKPFIRATFLFAIFVAIAAAAADELPATLLTKRGRLLASGDFSKTPASFTGTPVGFASGVSDWRFNAGPKRSKAGDGN